MAIYENVKAVLEKKNISIISFEEKIGLQRGGFYKWKNHTPNVIKVKQASEFLGVSMDDLLKE